MRKISLSIILIMCTLLLCSCQVRENYTITHSDNAIARLSIITYDGSGESVAGLANLGHSFLSIENLSNEDITLGRRVVAPNELVVFGTWSILEHFGVWYNVESNYIVGYNKYDGRVSISQDIDASQLSTISEFILNNDSWNPLKNCSCFAINLWNSISDEGEKFTTPLIYTPSKLKSEITKFDGYKTNVELPTDKTLSYYLGDTVINHNLEGVTA